MKTFEFTIKLVGKGEDESEAYADAVDAFCADVGDPHSTELIEDES